MRKRKNQVLLRLNDKEYNRFKKQVALSGLPMNSYMIHLINDYSIKERPPRDYPKILWELSRFANDIYHIKRLAFSTNSLGKKEAECALLISNKCYNYIRDNI
jgi:hypothetical protein